jgi:hypothetical protein
MTRLLPTVDSNPAVEPYEHRLTVDRELSMTEADRFFTDESQVHQTLRHVARELERLQLPYAVVGGMALYQHGFRRFTEDVDILVTRDSLRQIHAQLSGKGYLPPFEKSKNLRDTQTGVRIEFLVAGQFPGDGRPKPVAFPDPVGVTETIDGIAVATLPTLVELKLASGMTGTGRLKDLSDVQEMVKLFGLPREFADCLNPYVRDKFVELWQSTQSAARRYVRLWRRDEQDEELDAILRDGVRLDPAGDTPDHVLLVTDDPDVARKYDMHDEAEFLPAEGE